MISFIALLNSGETVMNGKRNLIRGSFFVRASLRGLDLEAGKESKLTLLNCSSQLINYRNGHEMEQAPMQTPQTPTRNREAENFVGNESFPELVDFPTVEELLAALDASLEESSWLPRPTPVAVDATSRALTQRWRELMGDISPDTFQETSDDHYLSSWREREVLSDDLLIEPDFLADFTKFLMRRVAERMSEIRQAQHLLVSELAKLRE